jgi:hypothetical protein
MRPYSSLPFHRSWMQILVFSLLLCVAVGPVRAQEDEATSQVGRIDIQPGEMEELSGPDLPANLGMEVDFSEPSGNNMIDAKETARLIVSLQNEGPGKGRGIDVWVTSDTTLPGGLTVGESNASVTASSEAPVEGAKLVAHLEELSASDSTEIEIPLQADRSIPDGEFPLTVHVTEKNKFGPGSPVEVRFPTRAFRPPALTLAGHVVEGSEDGRIGPSEIVTVRMRIQNKGLGPAKGVSVEVKKGSENVFFTGSSKRSFEVGRLQASEKQDISVQTYANNKAEAIPLVLSIRDEREEFSVTDTLELSLDRPQQDRETLIVSGDEGDEDTTQSAVDPLGNPVEQNIPNTSMSRENAVAVVLGIEEYPSNQVPDVKYAHRDAVFMKKYLKQTLGYKEVNILPRNLDSRVTTSQMKTLIKQRLPDFVRDSSHVFVYFSGHGAPGPEGKHAYLVGSDADPNYVSESNAYRVDRFREDLSRMAEEHSLASLTVALDACFSGQSRRGKMLIRQASPLTLSVENPLMLQENATVFAAGASDQVANWYPKYKHGMFTYFFLKGLKGSADLNNDQRVTTSEMGRYLTSEDDGVPYWSRRVHSRDQTPQVSMSDSSRVLVQFGQD